MTREDLTLLARAVIRRVAVRDEEGRRRYLAWLYDALGIGVEPPRLTMPLGVLAPELERWRQPGRAAGTKPPREE